MFFFKYCLSKIICEISSFKSRSSMYFKMSFCQISVKYRLPIVFCQISSFKLSSVKCGPSNISFVKKVKLTPVKSRMSIYIKLFFVFKKKIEHIGQNVFCQIYSVKCCPLDVVCQMPFVKCLSVIVCHM